MGTEGWRTKRVVSTARRLALLVSVTALGVAGGVATGAPAGATGVPGHVETIAFDFVPGNGAPLVLPQGSTLQLDDLDFAPHTVASDDPGSQSCYNATNVAFCSNQAFFSTAPVAGVAGLAPGTYG
ncbi:MAG: hypothetical protein ACYDAD_03920, partial [Acidimicrobiales bacterium]